MGSGVGQVVRHGGGDVVEVVVVDRGRQGLHLFVRWLVRSGGLVVGRGFVLLVMNWWCLVFVMMRWRLIFLMMYWGLVMLICDWGII